MITADETEVGRCARHGRETALRCGKCGEFICPRCSIQTPVGMRCARCAQIRRLPQFDVGIGLILRAVAAGLPTSLFLWFLASAVRFLLFFVAIFIGAAVGEVMSRMAKRRTSLPLEAAAVLVVLAGFVGVEAALLGSSGSGVGSVLTSRALAYLILPPVIAAFVAVVKLR